MSEQMRSQAIVEYGRGLDEVVQDIPTPEGRQVVVAVTHCGVCHSDVHFHDGWFDMGDGHKLDVTPARKTPFTLGHEIEGTILAAGPDAKNVEIGARCVVYPWIGCGDCPSCERGEEQLCNARALGVNWAGGFATHCLVPDEKYVLDCDGIPPGLAGTYMCSGITAYSALKRVGALGKDDPLLIVGLGGVGMMGLQFARAMFDTPPLVADIDASKRDAALQNGAQAAYDPNDKDAVKALLADTNGGAKAAVDFVGAEASLGFASACLRRGGDAIVVGLFGGKFSMPIPQFPFRAISIGGSMTGTLAETKDMLKIVKAGHIEPIPVEMRPLERASESLDDLRKGNIVGRVVLTPNL